MKTRLCALLLCLSLVAGCGSASSQAGSSSAASQEEYTPVYTYENPDPDMVLVTSPGGDITYKDYRLYLDVSEQMSRYYARQQMAMCATLERDFVNMGIAIDEDAYKTSAAQELLNNMMYSPSLAEDIETIANATGMTEEQITEAMMLSSRINYLINLLGEHYSALAEKEFPPVAAASSEAVAEQAAASTQVASGESAADAPSQSDNAQAAEAERQQAIYAKVTEMMQTYSSEYDSRLSFDDESVLVTLDGKAIPYTDVEKNYIAYMALGSRIDAAAFIQTGELVLRELEKRNTELDRAEFEETLAQYIAQAKSDPTFMTHLTKFSAMYGATIDDYFKTLERPLWLQQVGDLYYIAMTDEFNAMPQDAENRPASADDHYVAGITKLLEDSEVVNISGK